MTGRVRAAIVLRVTEGSCSVLGDGDVRAVRFARQFPTPRVERVSPGHVVAVGAARSRLAGRRYEVGARAYLSAGLPGGGLVGRGAGHDRPVRR